MKHLIMLLSVSSVFIVGSGCHKEEQRKKSLFCDYATGDSAKSQVGRVYKRLDPSPGEFLYYIGNPDPKLNGSGLIPCSGFPDELKATGEIGDLVIFSGIVMLGKDAEEPLYFGIRLTQIRRAE